MKKIIITAIILGLFISVPVLATTTASSTDKDLDAVKQQLTRVINLLSELVRMISQLASYDKTNNTHYASDFLNRPMNSIPGYSSGGGGSAGFGSGFGQQPATFGGMLNSVMGSLLNQTSPARGVSDSGNFSFGGISSPFDFSPSTSLLPASELAGGVFINSDQWMRGNDPKKASAGSACVRNNNFGNVKKPGADDWLGTTGYDGNGHAIFDEQANGVRAYMLNIVNQYKRGKFKSINQLLSYYTSVAGDRKDYADHIQKRTGFNPDADLKLIGSDGLPDKRILYPLARAMFEYECGGDPGISDILLEAGYKRAFLGESNQVPALSNPVTTNTTKPTKYVYTVEGCGLCGPKMEELRTQGFNVIEKKITNDQFWALGLSGVPHVVDTPL